MNDLENARSALYRAANNYASAKLIGTQEQMVLASAVLEETAMKYHRAHLMELLSQSMTGRVILDSNS